LAHEVAARLGLPTVGGSDAHMPLEIGRFATVFEAAIESEEQMITELRTGRFRAARRVEPGGFTTEDAPVPESGAGVTPK
jgi:hypothetical protein